MMSAAYAYFLMTQLRQIKAKNINSAHCYSVTPSIMSWIKIISENEVEGKR